MWFVHPGILAATVGIMSIPVLIHLINRRRFRSEPWAATQFLLHAHHQSRRRMRIDHWLLLLLRTLALGAIGLTVARPYMTGAVAGWTPIRQACDRVLIMDDSLSMQARREDGRSSFDAARNAALSLLDTLPQGDAVAVITGSNPPRALFNRPVLDIAEVRSAIAEMKPTAGRSDWVASMQAAADVLARGNAGPGRRMVYLFTDVCPMPSEASRILDRAARDMFDQIVIVNTGPSSRDNLSISNLRLEAPIVGPGIPTRIRFSVTNHGAAPVAQSNVRIAVDGRVVGTQQIQSLEAGETHDAAADIAFENAGPHAVRAVLTSEGGNALRADDARSLAVRVNATTRVLLVEGAPNEPVAQRRLFFCRTALNSRNHGGAEELVSLQTVSPNDIDQALLSEFDVILLGDVPRLSDRTWARLTDFTRAGGGLVIALGRQIDPAHYNLHLPHGSHQNETDSDDRVQSPPMTSIGAAEQSDDAAEPVRLNIVANDHPIMSDFSGRDEGGLRQALVRFRWHLDTDTEAAQSHGLGGVILRFSTGSPALVEFPVGRGRVMVLASGLTMAETTLPAKPDFVPFMFNLIGHAAGDPHERLNVRVGEPIISRLRADAHPTVVPVQCPDGSERFARDSAAAVALSATDLPGIYRMRYSGTEEWFAVNGWPEESDLRPAEPEMIQRMFGEKALILDDVVQLNDVPMSGSATEFAGVSMILLLVFVLFETWISAPAEAAS